jgi:hypothetical protein
MKPALKRACERPPTREFDQRQSRKIGHLFLSDHRSSAVAILKSAVFSRLRNISPTKASMGKVPMLAQ